MELQDYLDDNNISTIDFAKICRISPPVIYKMLNGGNISRRTARIVEKKTNGLVVYANLYKPNGRKPYEVET